MRSAEAPFDGAAFLEKSRKEVESRIGSWYRGHRGIPSGLKRACLYAALGGGKRLRPAVVFAACEAAGGARRDALGAACAIEMIHNYSLIHDDLPCMDDDDYRRGRPTVHRVFGEATAVLAGDALLTDAFALFASWFGPGDPRNGRITLELASAAGSFGMAGGQALDIGGGGRTGRAWMEKMSAMKTGRLFEAAARTGGVCAGAPTGVLRRLELFGKDLGLAFQIADDILDARAGKREAFNYSAMLGEGRARERLLMLAGRAGRRAANFGKKGKALGWLAQYVAGGADRPVPE
jgi:geranylgeranyl pyrophosphate synthase